MDDRATRRLDARGFAAEDERHVHVHRVLEVDQEEVDVQRASGERVALNVFDDGARGGPRTVDLDLDDARAAGGLPERLEGLRLELHGRRIGAFAEDDAGNEALAPQAAVFLARCAARVEGDLQVHECWVSSVGVRAWPNAFNAHVVRTGMVPRACSCSNSASDRSRGLRRDEPPLLTRGALLLTHGEVRLNFVARESLQVANSPGRGGTRRRTDMGGPNSPRRRSRRMRSEGALDCHESFSAGPDALFAAGS